MSTLAEIEMATEALPPEQQQELLLFLATRLHGRGGALPPPQAGPEGFRVRGGCGYWTQGSWCFRLPYPVSKKIGGSIVC